MNELTITGNGGEFTNTQAIVGEGRPGVVITGNNNVFTNAAGGSIVQPGDSSFAAIQLDGTGNTVRNEAEALLGALDTEIALIGSAGADIVANTGQRSGLVLLGEGNDFFLEAGLVVSTLDNAATLDLGAGDDVFLLVLGAADFVSVQGDTLFAASVEASGGAGFDVFQINVEGASTLAGINTSGFEELRFGSATSDTPPAVTLSGLSDFQNIVLERAFDLTLTDFNNSAASINLNGSSLTFGADAQIGTLIGGEADETVELTTATSQAAAVLLGGGNDTLAISGGATVAGQIDGGAGTDSLFLSGLTGSTDLSRYSSFEAISLSSSAAEDIVIFGSTSAAGLRIDAPSVILTGIDSAAPLAVNWLGDRLVVAEDMTLANLKALAVAGATDPFVLELAGTVNDGITFAAGNDTFLNSGTVNGAVDFAGGDDRYTATEAGTVAGGVSGGAGNDVLVGAAAAERLDGGEGNDTLSGGAGNDALTGGAGNDVLTGGAGIDDLDFGTGDDRASGAIADFFGDTIRSFGSGDELFFQGRLFRDQFEFSDAGDTTVVSYDSDDVDTLPDGTFTLQGSDVDLTAGDFLFAGVGGGNTVAELLPFLPTLAEGAAIADAAVTGVLSDAFLTGATSNRFQVDLEPADAAADFDNSLGVYEIDAAGNIVDVRIIAENVKTSAGTIEVSGVEAGNSLGFFIVQDGANRVDAATLQSDALGIDTSSGTAVLTVAEVAVAGAVIFVSHDASLNPSGEEHVVSGVSEGQEGALRLAFEDLIRDGTADNDFQDVVFAVEALPADAPII